MAPVLGTHRWVRLFVWSAAPLAGGSDAVPAAVWPLIR